GPNNRIRRAGSPNGLHRTGRGGHGRATAPGGNLRKGVPKESFRRGRGGGGKNNLRMPDLVSMGNGGGSVVRKVDGRVTIGPDSVGYSIVTEGIAWGGSTVTATDVALADGYAEISGDPRVDVSRTKKLEKEFVKSAVSKIVENVEKSIDMIKTSRESMPVVLVGRGGIILPGSHSDKLKGSASVIRPPNFQLANARGAELSQVSAGIDRGFSLE